jgi:hypothetical protein
MQAIANSPAFAKKVGVKQSVGKDFEMADKKKAKKFGDGGMAKKPMPASPAMPREPITGGPDTVPLTPERKEFLKELERRNKEARDESVRSAKKATPHAKGGKVMKKATKAGAAMVKKSADTMGRAMKFAKGGGIETKGKTKGKMVTMKSGGSC